VLFRSVLSGFQAYEAEAFLINDIPFSELQVYHYRKIVSPMHFNSRMLYRTPY